MPIPFTCPHCQQQSTIEDHFAGQTGPCNNCGKKITIPGPVPSGPAVRKTSYVIPFVIALVIGGMLCMTLCCGSLILLPAIGAAREAARRTQCGNNLKQIGLALHNYHDAYLSFPAPHYIGKDGQPTHSWRVAILPFLEHRDLYDKYNVNEPWDGPNNSKLHDQMPDVYRCPTVDLASGMTSYMVVASNQEDRNAGTVFTRNVWNNLASITDGTSNTIMVVEVAGSSTHWMAPQDLDMKTMQMAINAVKDGTSISSNHAGGANVVFADGSLHFLDDSLRADELRNLLVKDDGLEIDRTSIDRPKY